MNIKENDSIQYDLSEAKPKNYTEKESKETCMFHADSGNKLLFYIFYNEYPLLLQRKK